MDKVVAQQSTVYKMENGTKILTILHGDEYPYAFPLGSYSKAMLEGLFQIIAKELGHEHCAFCSAVPGDTCPGMEP